MNRCLPGLLIFLSLMGPLLSNGQQRFPPSRDSLSLTPADSTKPVEILHADRLTLQKKDSVDLQILVGKVELQQGQHEFRYRNLSAWRKGVKW